MVQAEWFEDDEEIAEMLEGMTRLLDWWQDKEGLPTQCAREQRMEMRAVVYEPRYLEEKDHERVEWLDSFCCLWDTLEKAQQEKKRNGK